MNLHSCIVGNFSYVQAGELFHRRINPGTVWIRNPNFEFKYKFKKEILDNFVGVNAAYQPRGLIYDFVKEREHDYEKLFDVMNIAPVKAPASSAVNRYARVQGKTIIGENVLISQRAFLDNAIMGDGSNAQENSYIINSTLAGLNVTTHGGKLLYTRLGLETYIGFNAFLNGKKDAPIRMGEGCIVMPHTIIDSCVPINIPDEHLVWGFIGSAQDIENHSMPIDDLASVLESITIGKMTFTGMGSVFIDSLQKRIRQVLLANGARFINDENRGHAQDDQNISFNIIQPYTTGPSQGLYPSIRIKP
jgi:carbonic anhydrase/acetyltransferase-like protein (isoleucine patch superfamily)